jgi:glycosyltransferase involved in cell wall biosynthesis
VVLMGWGRLEPELRRAIDAQPTHVRVQIIAPVPQEELLAVAAGADLGLIPYEPHGMNNLYATPNKLFEYMAAGLPIVASRLPELSHFINEHRIGATFAPSNPHDMARVLNEVLAAPQELAEMAERARAAAKVHCWANEREKLLGLYAGLSGGRVEPIARRRFRGAPAPAAPS